MSIQYTDPALVTAVKIVPAPYSGRTATGYGGQIPTAYMIRYRRHWHRVYAAVYGNAAAIYIHSLGTDLYLDTDTEHSLWEAKAA